MSSPHSQRARELHPKDMSRRGRAQSKEAPRKDARRPEPRVTRDNGAAMVLHPHSRIVQNWNMIVGGLLCFQAVELPLQLTFISDEMFKEMLWLVLFNCWSELVLSLDIVLQFMLQIQSPDKTYWIASQREIIVKYVRTEFVIDLISVLPLRYILTLLIPLVPYAFLELMPDFGPAASGCWIHVIGFHKLLRFTRVFRISRSLEAHDATQYMHFTYRQSRLVKSFMTIGFGCHVMGCLWASLAICGEGEYTWFDFLSILKGKETDEAYQPHNYFSLYLISLYWAVFTLTGIGYGDIVPVSPVEYIMATMCMFSGSLVWAWVVANIVSIMGTMNQAANDHLQSLDCINELLKENPVQVSLGRRVREYFTKMKDITQAVNVSSLIKRLSPELRIEAVHAIHGHWLQQVWWLNKAPQKSEFYVELTLKMRSSLHTPNELIPNKQELCVIRQGLCIHGGALKTRGMIFGEDMLLNNEALRKPFATLALTFLHISILPKPLLNKLVAKYPDVSYSIRRSYVIFAIIRGMLYKAEIYRRTEKEGQQAKNQGRGKGAGRASMMQFAVTDKNYVTKPKGDVEDILCDMTADDTEPGNTRGGNRRGSLVSESSPSAPASRNVSREVATTKNASIPSRASNIPGTTRASQHPRVSAYDAVRRPSISSNSSGGSKGSSLNGGFPEQKAVVAPSSRGNQGGVSKNEADSLLANAKQVHRQLSQRIGALEASAGRLVRQAVLLQDC